MEVISPNKISRRLPNVGDIVVFESYEPLFMIHDDDQDNLLNVVGMKTGYIGTAHTPDGWIRLWDETENGKFTIYSSDEWAFKLVQK